VHLVALLHVWESAGLSAESILAAIEAGELSLEFLETPAWRLPEPLALTYREFAEQQTGYTCLTEEQGDEAAARLASNLSALVDDISRHHGGRPIRWLGDGGMFHFKEAGAAVLAALEMAEEALAAGLPPTHIGIQAGPVIFQDGDVYGRTFNIAARIADRAQAGEVLTSEETVEQVEWVKVRFERVGPTELKGVAQPVTLYRAVRGDPPTGTSPQ
jgi:class 3 adenylate cyclase